MTFPEWTKPGAYGAVVGAIAISIIGFSWGGWTTAATAQDMAQDLADQEVTLALVPLCLNLSAADPERAAKLAIIQETAGYNQSKALMEAGWATVPGSDEPNRDLAKACIEGLELEDA